MISDQQAELITWVYCLSGAITFFSCVIFSIYVFTSLLCMGRKLDFMSLYSFVILFFLATTDMITGFIYMMSWVDFERELICEYGGFLTQITQTSSVFWVDTICISLYLVYNYTKRVSVANPSILKSMIFGFILIFPILCWGIPTCIALFLYRYGSFSNLGHWCWMKDHELSRLLFLFLPILIGFIVSVVVLSMVTRKRNLSNYGAVIVDLTLYVLAFSFVWTIPIINSIVVSATSDHILILEFLTAFTLPLQGFCNFLIWGLLMKLRKYKYSNLDAHSDTELDELAPLTRKTKKIHFFGRDINLRLPIQT